MFSRSRWGRTRSTSQGRAARRAVVRFMEKKSRSRDRAIVPTIARSALPVAVTKPDTTFSVRMISREVGLLQCSTSRSWNAWAVPASSPDPSGPIAVRTRIRASSPGRGRRPRGGSERSSPCPSPDLPDGFVSFASTENEPVPVAAFLPIVSVMGAAGAAGAAGAG
ncbi:MAG: hypothetical protein BRD30_12680 [Bacteroidetes bacterium QH_2_63_10]|nr:MAG: hypothetical protein BRD30_12680 [Bacteroidetes bacterium QH_2_63_10]